MSGNLLFPDPTTFLSLFIFQDKKACSHIRDEPHASLCFSLNYHHFSQYSTPERPPGWLHVGATWTSSLLTTQRSPCKATGLGFCRTNVAHTSSPSIRVWGTPSTCTCPGKPTTDHVKCDNHYTRRFTSRRGAMFAYVFPNMVRQPTQGKGK
jgi:hypothetical protein